MTQELRRRIGFELELLAPVGSSRRTLADRLARGCGGSIRFVWHEDSEPALVARLGGRFLHLTQGFEVLRPTGEPLCSLVDDVTIVAELDQKAPAEPGWHRILTDDPRLLRLIANASDPAGPVEQSLDAVAALWGVEVEQHGTIWRVESDGATIALATAASTDRQRPCEIVTPPLTHDHGAALDALLSPARELGFTVPVEAAVHLHVDGAPFRDAATLANLIRLFGLWRNPLRALLGTNEACQRLAPLPASLVELVAAAPSYDDIAATAKAADLTKFYDVNLTQLFSRRPIRDTVEIRILPGALEADGVVARAAIIEGLLDRCEQPERFPAPPADLAAAVDALRELAASLS